jgi:hypothetical protein
LVYHSWVWRGLCDESANPKVPLINKIILYKHDVISLVSLAFH